MRDLDHDGAVVVLFLLRVFRGLRHQRIEPLRGHRRNDHKHDQKHQQNIDHRGHVDACIKPATTTCIECHFVPRLTRAQPFGPASSCLSRLKAIDPPAYCPAGGVAGGGWFCSVRRSVNRPTWSTPAVRTSSIASMTVPYCARASARIKICFSVLFCNISATLAPRSAMETWF